MWVIISHTGLETSHPPMDNHGRLTENVYSQPVVTISLKERAAPKDLPVATVSLALCKGSEWLETEHGALPVQPKSCRRCNCYSSVSRFTATTYWAVGECHQTSRRLACTLLSTASVTDRSRPNCNWKRLHLATASNHSPSGLGLPIFL